MPSRVLDKAEKTFMSKRVANTMGLGGYHDSKMSRFIGYTNSTRMVSVCEPNKIFALTCEFLAGSHYCLFYIQSHLLINI